MGFMSGMTTGIYRHTTDGRRVYRVGFMGGLAKRWYHISDVEAPRFERRLRLYFGLTVFAIIPVAVLIAGDAWWMWVGEPMLWLLLVADIAMTANAVFALTLGFDWLIVLGLAMFTVLGGFMVRGIIMIRRARREMSAGSA